ncbi:bifunctional DNA primase/polymerase [Gemmatimonas sp.]|jgi:hypothetical protein|uniref:bifunctional DNA primase/polymerase n=1 Tax=Gemmatimonas sp. TaxID=1962908 RepID=UPI0037C0CB34
MSLKHTPREVWTHALELTTTHSLAILPIRPGTKVPATPHGVKDASSQRAHVLAWAAAMPSANIGISAGGPLRLLVVDVDGPTGNTALARFGPLPPTWTAITPKGGRHFYFTAPDDGVPLGNTARKLGPELDTRGSGGYVVAPPSILGDGRCYAWVSGCSPADLSRAVLPEAILKALRTPRQRPDPTTSSRAATTPTGDLTRRVAGYLAKLRPLADGEGRNHTAFTLAAFVLHDCGGSTADALIALAVWNACNHEPLPATALSRLVRNAAIHGGRHVA